MVKRGRRSCRSCTTSLHHQDLPVTEDPLKEQASGDWTVWGDSVSDKGLARDWVSLCVDAS